jgi:type IV secretion system protein VirB6
MRNIIAIFLVLYISFSAYKILFSGQIPTKGILLIKLIKIILVIYFAVGINNGKSSGDYHALNGITDFLLPIVFGAMDFLSNLVFSINNNGLCDFSTVNYEEGFKHLALWDAIDCRLSHYIGLDVIQNYKAHKNIADGHLNFPVPPFFYLLIFAIFSGNFTIIAFVLSYPLLILFILIFVFEISIFSIGLS